MTKIGDYTVLPLAIQPTPAFPKATTHTLYLRAHTPKIPTESSSRSLFLVNVPIDSTFAHLRAVFTSIIGAGRFESVSFEAESKTPKLSVALTIQATTSKNKKRKRVEGIEEDREIEALPAVWDRDLRRSGSTAVVVLVDERSVEGVLKAVRKLYKSSKPRWPIWGEGISDKVSKLGSRRYLTHHSLRFPDNRTLQRHVDEFMTSFNANEEEKARREKRMRNVPDEDGFVTVMKGGRTGPARKAEAEEKQRILEEREKKKREGMGDFYRFQMRERRKEEQAELVRGFEVDRKRVDEMRERRGRFRPEK